MNKLNLLTLHNFINNIFINKDELFNCRTAISYDIDLAATGGKEPLNLSKI